MSEEIEINIGNIGPRILLSMKNPNGVTWNMVLGELCDNALDAEATRIDIDFSAKSLTITDDGCGCDNIDRMLTLGDHYHRSSTKLGRYGVGLKDAACWLWGRLIVRTTNDFTQRMAKIDWESLSHSSSWRLIGTETVCQFKSGTQLVFDGFKKKLPDFDKLATDLGYVFAPAILSGRQIKITRPRKQPILVRAWQMPPLTGLQVNERFEINGKVVHLMAGIVADGVLNPRSGFSVCHEHRIICNTSFGSGGHSTARFCGMIILDDSWKLSRNKTELVDDDSEDLSAAIFYHCEPLLRQSSEQAKYLRNTALETAVTEKLRGMLSAGIKEKRDSPSNETGGVTPKATGRKRNPKSKTQPGNKISSRLAGRVRMEWRPREDGLIGEVDIPGSVIYLNSEHARLSFHQRMENDDALADACMMLITFEEMAREEKSKLFKDFSGYIEALSSVLTQQQPDDQLQEATQ